METTRRYRILVGLSGGVDSAMAALLLREQGHDVVGVMMSLQGDDDPLSGCGAPEDAEAARRLADEIGIPFQVLDCSAAYRRAVLDNFRAEYLAGRTPNPCVQCNPAVKFGALPGLARAAGIEFDRFATGHYARIDYSLVPGRPVLRRGVDPAKDQSYFLYRLSAEQLAATLFPLGEFHKTEVRRLAAERGLHVHDRPDSQDFREGGYAQLLDAPPREGDIVLADDPDDLDGSRGRVVGKHTGYWNFTPGQRRGLGVAHREPLYVLGVVPAMNRVVVATRAASLSCGCVADDLCFNLPIPAPGTKVTGRLRSSQPLREMTVAEAADGCLQMRFTAPQQGVAPGQSLVLYNGDMVIGGGIIRRALSGAAISGTV